MEAYEEKNKMTSQKIKGEISEDVLYRYISKHSGLSTYELSKQLKWEGGKVRTVLARIEKAGLIKTEYVQDGHKIKKVSRPATLKEFVKPSESSESAKKENIHSSAISMITAKTI